MELELEKKKEALKDFKAQVKEMNSLLIKISELDYEVFDSAQTKLVVEPVEAWQALGADVFKSQFYHAFIGSTTDFLQSPDLDLPGGQVSKHVREIALPTLRLVLEELQKTENK